MITRKNVYWDTRADARTKETIVRVYVPMQCIEKHFSTLDIRMREPDLHKILDELTKSLMENIHGDMRERLINLLDLPYDECVKEITKLISELS